jgi:hypothetical protein
MVLRHESLLVVLYGLPFLLRSFFCLDLEFSSNSTSHNKREENFLSSEQILRAGHKIHWDQLKSEKKWNTVQIIFNFLFRILFLHYLPSVFNLSILAYVCYFNILSQVQRTCIIALLIKEIFNLVMLVSSLLLNPMFVLVDMRREHNLLHVANFVLLPENLVANSSQTVLMGTEYAYHSGIVLFKSLIPLALFYCNHFLPVITLLGALSLFHHRNDEMLDPVLAMFATQVLAGIVHNVLHMKLV